MAKQETPGDWTHVVTTRISTRADKLVDEKLNSLGGLSRSVWVRQLIYRELGILVAEAPLEPKRASSKEPSDA